MTKNCIALQNEIETLIRRGKLVKYVDRGGERRNNDRTRERSRSPHRAEENKKRNHEVDPEDDPDLSKKPRQPEREVFSIRFGSFDCNVITGGDAGGGDLTVERKSYLGEA